MDPKPAPFRPHEIAPFAVLMVISLLVGLLLSIHSAQAVQPAAGSTNPVEATPFNRTIHASVATLGSATLDLNALAAVDNVDESDNARWSLARGLPEGSSIYNAANGVEWAALRTLSASGAFRVPAGSSWTFNATFGGGPGYKQASGVLAGGQCALATVFRAAAMQAGLPTKGLPHARPVPGFSHDETVTIWWGTYDLKIKNPTNQDLYLVWKLSAKSIQISVENQIPS